MRLLLDTHTLLWWLADEPLSDRSRRTIADPRTTVYVSAVSAWEISIKIALGKLEAPGDLEAQIERHRFRPLPVTIGHALRAGGLPPLHVDPFDRMLVAQAQLEEATIVTRDPALAGYGVPTLVA